jgi:prolyl oligopeptidase
LISGAGLLDGSSNVYERLAALGKEAAMPTDRRFVVKSAGALALTAIVPALARIAASSPLRPPVARVDPVTDIYFGTEVVDPYRWMENSRNPEWLPFLQGQNSYARSVLDKVPGRAGLLKRISAVSGDVAITTKVHLSRNRLFFQQRPAGSENFKLFVRSEDGSTRVLIDPTVLAVGDAHVSLDWWEPSNDGTHVAYGLSPAGSEASVLHVVVVDSGEILPERIEKTDSAMPSWLPDGSGFFYIQFTGERGTPSFYLNSQARLHRLRTDPSSDTVVLKRGIAANVPIATNQYPYIMTAAGSRFVIVLVGDVRPEFSAWSALLTDVLSGNAQWKSICTFEDAVTSFALQDEALYLVANRGLARGHVLRTTAAAPDLSTAAELLPQGSSVIETLAAARDGVYVRLMDGGVHRLLRIASDGSIQRIALPFDGAINAIFATADHDGAYLDLTSWLVPRGVWHVDASGTITDTGLTPRPSIDVSGYEVLRGFAEAKDGVRIPYWLLARKGVSQNGANPTLVTGYGAYQISMTPRFSPTLLPFLDAGGVYVVANVRGGGEYGREWHAAGQRDKKPNTWRDLIAVCEHLVATRITNRTRLAVSGTSAGGIAVGRALTERPELFAAAISNVGWSNPLRYVAEQNSFGEIGEWGSIEDEEGFRALLAMDSYQAVKSGVAYPAVLCTTGVTDPRVAPFHVAKFAARLQAATVSAKPVLLRVDFDAGHGIGSTRSQSDALSADTYAFVLWRTGVKGFQPA